MSAVISNSFETIIYQKRDGIAYVTLNRPKMLNVYNIKMRDELFEVLQAIRDDNEADAVIINGAGDRAFCAGADLSEFLTAPSPIIARRVRWERDVWGVFLNLPQIAIAAMHGYVLGSGIEMALCCDIRIASEDVRFGLPEINLGIIPAAGATQTLPRTVGRAHAMNLLMSGELVSAVEALRCGLVNTIVPGDQLISSADEIAQKIQSFDKSVVRKLKLAVNRGLDLSLSEGLELERRLSRNKG